MFLKVLPLIRKYRIFFNILTILFDKKSHREIALGVRTIQSGINFIAFAYLGSNNSNSLQANISTTISNKFIYIYIYISHQALFTSFLDFKLTKRLVLDVCRID